jgi:RND family efflux transporter MFP subunit
MHTPGTHARVRTRTPHAIRIAAGTALLAGTLLVSACGSDHEPPRTTAAAPQVAGEPFEISAAPRQTHLRAAGTAEPLQQATLSTKLLGAVTQVMVQEGDVVRAGQPLLRIDARDLAAKAAQLDAAHAEASAVHREASLHADRMRALFADDAAPKAQLDAAETGLARAAAGLDAVRANRAELLAASSYSVVTAPFAGTVVRRMVDPGSFAAPGAPLLVLQDVSSLRVRATTAPDDAMRLVRGQEVAAIVEGRSVPARIEGVVPTAGGSLYAVNAIVANPGGLLAAGGVAALELPAAVRTTMVIPQRAVVREGELTGVHLQRDGATVLRWVRLGPVTGDSVEVHAGLQAGDRVIVPAAIAGAR